MEVKTAKVSSLSLDPSNVRKHDPKNLGAIKASLKKFGQQKPIVVGKDGVVIAGNGTLAAAKELGWDQINVVTTDLTGTMAAAYGIADNRTSDLSDWDSEDLKNMLSALEADGFGLGELGFDGDDLSELGFDVAAPAEKLDPVDDPDDGLDEIPDKVEAVCKVGQYWQLGEHRLYCGSCEDLLAKLDDNQVAAVVTDPPYGLAFMGKKWDYDVPSVDVWQAIYRVLKPGGHLLSFGGTRTYHRMVVNVEDGGFEIRDQLQWLYGSGFPKSLNIGKAMDKAVGVEREVVGKKYQGLGNGSVGKTYGDYIADHSGVDVTAPATDLAKQWDGWGTALKPANEPIVLARKPISEKTTAANVEKWGVGGINVGKCRVGMAKDDAGWNVPLPNAKTISPARAASAQNAPSTYRHETMRSTPNAQGRFPANVILDETAAAMLDEQSGGASRFFYCAKASRSERNDGCDANFHPTVKPIKLMAYLCQLVTPHASAVLEPFAGSGTTLLAAELLGMQCFAAEMEPAHCDIIIARWQSQTGKKATCVNIKS